MSAGSLFGGGIQETVDAEGRNEAAHVACINSYYGSWGSIPLGTLRVDPPNK